MFGTIRKHQTWLWAIIITLTIISFVVFFSPYTKMSGGSGPANFGSINGQPISRDQFANAWREVQLRYFFMSGGQWPDQDAKRMGFDLDRETYQWLLLLQKIDQTGIQVDPNLVARTAAQMLQRFERAGVSSPEAFVSQILAPHGIGAGDFQRYVQHSLAVQELIATVALSGKLVTPEEAKSMYVREHQEVASEAVFFSSSNYLSSVTVTPEAVAQFYTNRMAQFRIPERVQVSYVAFGISNLLGQAEQELAKTNLSELVDMNLQRLGTNYTQFGKTPEEAKTKIREELVRNQAQMQARRKALEFASQLFDKEPMQPQNLETLAKAQGLTVQVTAPFTQMDGPAGLQVGPDFTTKAFGLNPTTEPFAGPIAGRDAVYVLAFNKKIPSELPPLDSVREKVVAAYQQNQAINLARQAGLTARTTLTNALAQGKSFEAACAAANLKPVSLPPVSMSTRSLPSTVEDHVGLTQLKEAAFSTPPGTLSNFQPTSDGGLVLYVKSKLPLDEAKMKTDLPAFVDYVRQQRQNEAFNDWFRKEAEHGLRDIPAFQQRQPSAGAATGAGRS